MLNTWARSYLKEFGIAIVGYMVVLAISVTWLNGNPDGPWRVLVALAPMVPALFAVLVVVRHLGRLDELQRRIQLEAIAFAFGGTAVLTFSYGFLELVGFPHVNWHFVWPLMATLWLVGAALAMRRYA
jgi:hypothetical protein